MESQIDPTLAPATSGEHIGKVLSDDLRLQLTKARDESTQHGNNIEALQELAEEQRAKTDLAILYDAESGKAKLPNGDLVTLGGAHAPLVLSVGDGSVNFGD